MIRSHWAFAGVAALSIMASSPLLAEQVVEQAGMVKVSKGAVGIERAGRLLAATVGTPIHVADRVRTGADGSVGVTLRDNTLLSAGPNSLIDIDRFAYDSVTQAGKISVGVRKGTLAVASGRIAKRTPESVDFHTPTSILGVRGTEFVIEVADGGNE